MPLAAAWKSLSPKSASGESLNEEKIDHVFCVEILFEAHYVLEQSIFFSIYK